MDESEQDRRWQRLQINSDAVIACESAIYDISYIAIGPGEVEEYEHIDLEKRLAEATCFYYWLFSELIVNSTDYAWKDDFRQWLAHAVVARRPEVARILPERYVEYAYELDPAGSLRRKAGHAFRRMLQHIDPNLPVPAEYTAKFWEPVLDSTVYIFRELPQWR